eukprot:g72472.t1
MEAFLRQYEEQQARREPRIVQILCSCFSPDGRYLLAGSQRGIISVFAVTAKPREGAQGVAALFSWAAHAGPVDSLYVVQPGAGSPCLLASGADTELRLWRWDDVRGRLMHALAGQPPLQPVQELHVPQARGLRGALKQWAEFNDSVLHRGLLWTACGDGQLYAWDMETGKTQAQLQGHEDAVYCVRTCEQKSSLCSASEDGTVRLWDARSGQCNKVLDALHGRALSSTARLAGRRPWVNCLDVDSSARWLLCGGGAGFVAVWHLDSWQVTATLPTAGTPQDACFADQRILSVGSEPVLYQWNHSGKLIARIQASSPSLFSLALHPNPKEHVVAVTGNTSTIDTFYEPALRSFKYHATCCSSKQVILSHGIFTQASLGHPHSESPLAESRTSGLQPARPRQWPHTSSTQTLYCDIEEMKTSLEMAHTSLSHELDTKKGVASPSESPFGSAMILSTATGSVIESLLASVSRLPLPINRRASPRVTVTTVTVPR